MNKVFKKRLLGGLALSGMGSALVLASCSVGSSQFDQNNDKTLKFALSITNRSVVQALDLILETYNATHKEASGLKWERMEIKGGYSGLDEVLNTYLPAKNGKDLFNVTLNYPSALAIATKYGMGLPIDKKELDLSTIFSKQFLDVNDNFTGSEKGVQWTAPVNKSTDMLSLNMPMLAYVFSKGEADGMEVEGKNIALSEAKVNYDKIVAAGENDKQFLEKVFGSYVSSADGLQNYKFNFSLFQSYETLIDFINRVGVAFPNFIERKGDNSLKTVGKNLLGLDSSTNSLYAAAFASVGADYEKFLFSLTNDRSEMNFNNVLDKPDSEQYKTLKKVYEVFQKGIGSQQLFIKNKSTYSSNYQKFHQLMVAIGSTAGYVYNFISGGTEIFEVTKKNGDKLPNQIGAFELFKPKADGSDGADVLAITKSGNHRNKVYKSTYTGAVDRYSVLSASPEMDTKLTTLAAAASEDGVLGLRTSLDEDNAKGEDVLGYVEGDKASPSKIVYFFEVGKYAKSTVDAKETLQQNELLVLQAPAKLMPTDAKEVAILQGPSLFAIHANEEENAETQKFMKWFLTASQEWTPKPRNANDKPKVEFTGTPAEYFAFKGNYIIPSKSFLGDATKKGNNPGTQVSLDNIKKMEQGVLSGMEDPVESRSSIFRSSIDDSMHQMYNRAGSKGTPKITFSDFLESLKTFFHRSRG